MFDQVTLCMMVRDEVVNPAGGLLASISNAEYFKRVIIADTGSIDGTGKILDHISERYPQIKVVNLPFVGYVETRKNIARLATTPYVCFLDADEILRKDDAEIVNETFNKRGNAGSVTIPFCDIRPGQPEKRYSPDQYSGHLLGGWNPRLYDKDDSLFEERPTESLMIESGIVIANGAYIRHFRPSLENELLKGNSLYQDLRKPASTPSSLSGFLKWKLPDVKTLSQYGINFREIIETIGKLGIKLPEEVTNLNYN